MHKRRLSNRRRHKRRYPWFVTDDSGICTAHRTAKHGWRWRRDALVTEDGWACFSIHRTIRSALRSARRIAELGGQPVVSRYNSRRDVWGRTSAWVAIESTLLR